MTAAGIDLALARREAESEMRAQCSIEGEPVEVWNPVTLQYDVTPNVVYTGKCKVRFGKVGIRQGEQAGQVFIEQGATLSLPFSEPTSADVAKDHIATITAYADDPAMVGMKVRIGASRFQSNATSRRFPITETQ